MGWLSEPAMRDSRRKRSAKPLSAAWNAVAPRARPCGRGRSGARGTRGHAAPADLPQHLEAADLPRYIRPLAPQGRPDAARSLRGRVGFASLESNSLARSSGRRDIMISAPWGTPSVRSLSVASRTGAAAAMTRSEAEPGSVEMNDVQGSSRAGRLRAADDRRSQEVSLAQHGVARDRHLRLARDQRDLTSVHAQDCRSRGHDRWHAGRV